MKNVGRHSTIRAAASISVVECRGRLLSATRALTHRHTSSTTSRTSNVYNHLLLFCVDFSVFVVVVVFLFVSNFCLFVLFDDFWFYYYFVLLCLLLI
jgi:hypothetical protein